MNLGSDARQSVFTNDVKYEFLYNKVEQGALARPSDNRAKTVSGF